MAIDAAPADKDSDGPVARPAAVAKQALESQESPEWEDGSVTAFVSLPAAEIVPNVMEDMLAMVGMSHCPDTQQDAEVASDEEPAAPLAPPMPAKTATLLPSLKPAAESSSSTAQPSGEHFMAWLQQGIALRRLIINDAKALVHTVSDTVYLVSPGVFQRYAQEHPRVANLAKQENVSDWQWIQKRFEKLQVHLKQNNGLNIWTCEVTGPRKSRRLYGYLLLSPTEVLKEVPPNNPYLALLARNS